MSKHADIAWVMVRDHTNETMYGAICHREAMEKALHAALDRVRQEALEEMQAVVIMATGQSVDNYMHPCPECCYRPKKLEAAEAKPVSEWHYKGCAIRTTIQALMEKR